MSLYATRAQGALGRGALAWALVALMAWGCSDDDAGSSSTSNNATPNASTVNAGTTAPPPFQVSPAPSLVWKRQAALGRDLGRALQLPADELCNELGGAPCAEVHEVSLGGNDPYQIGLYEPVENPLASTPVVIDRFVLGACSAAAERDQAGPALVFTDLDLSAPDVGADGVRASAEAQVGALYRALLSRDAQPEEVAIVMELTQDASGAPVSALDFAKASCFTIATTTEFLFY